MYQPKPEHEVIWITEHKVNLTRAQDKEITAHLKKTNGEFGEMDIWSASERVWVCGPEGILDWVDAHRQIDAYEIFCDYCCAEDLAWVNNWYFNPEDKELYVAIEREGFGISNPKEVMAFPEWEKEIDEINLKNE